MDTHERWVAIRRACLALRALLALAAIFAAAPAFAADCTQWDMSGRWVLIQTNNTAVSLNLEPSANGFAGQASFGHWVKDDFFLCNIGSCAGDVVNISGPAVGRINGNSFELTVYWSDNAIGVYSGQIGPQGLIVGTTFDKNDPRTTAQWHSNRVAVCSAAAPPPARTGLQLRRVPSTGTAARPTSLCDAAKSAQ